MAFYDGWGKKIQQTGQGAVDRTKRGAEVMRLNGSINSLEKEINLTYTDLGKAYYEKYASDIDDEDMIPYFQKIEGCLSQIRDYKDQINTLKGKTKCVNCGREISATAAFCNYCGAQQVPDAEVGEGTRICPNCGQVLQEDQLFCTNCGQRVEIEETVQTEQQPAGDKQIRICPNCGREIDPDAAFCAYCGQKYEEPEAGAETVIIVEEVERETSDEPEILIEPETSAEPEILIEPETSAEPEILYGPDGEKTVIFCVHCGTQVEPGDAFCTNCGKPIEN